VQLFETGFQIPRPKEGNAFFFKLHANENTFIHITGLFVLQDQINIETKVKIVRFIGELTKFGMYPRSDALLCFKMLLLNFAHHYIEMCVHLVETCGRFLLHHPDSHQRTKIYLVI
jgi:hypothetical protein